MNLVVLSLFLSSVSRFVALTVIFVKMLLERFEIQRRLPKYLDLHLLLLYLDEHVQLAEDRLDGVVATLIILQKLLHIS